MRDGRRGHERRHFCGVLAKERRSPLFHFTGSRKYRMAVTDIILREYRALTERIAREECPNGTPAPFVDWIGRTALLVEPSPLGKQLSRDVKDDPFLACALASGAQFIVSKDKDLLTLNKSFGVEIVTPRELYRRLKE